ncbi:MAG: hypothetical protein AMJ92_01380 [candidate division Zixibacteria bacterium SM23_81]|nr:MAG: hypothetical protein AMJ92_01380 [candidate division Zixibacteria bacterium SM23_81]
MAQREGEKVDFRSLDTLRQELERKNAQLEAQTRWLSEIQNLSQVLGRQLELEDLLDQVAQAVQRSLGFRRVLISLYDRDHHMFIRKAQAGLSQEVFQRFKGQRVPEDYFFQFFQDEHKISNSYFINNQQGTAPKSDLKMEGQSAHRTSRYPDGTLFTPLVRTDGKLLGVMSVDGPLDGQGPDAQTIALLELFAIQATQALQNLTLPEPPRVPAKGLNILCEISREIGSFLEFDLLLERIVEVVKARLKCRQCAILLWDEEREEWTEGAPKGDSRVLLAKLAEAEGLIQQVVEKGRPVISAELSLHHKEEESSQKGGFTALLPLKVQEKLIGLLMLMSQGDTAFGDYDELFWGALSDQVSMALGNARAYQNAKQHSITDGLTKLFNHRHFQERLRDEESRSHRHHRSFSVIMLDIDFFKHYNDVCGHPTGDKILRIIAQLIKAEIRDIDILARYGGEEFAIILTETNKMGAWKVAERIRKKIGDYKFPHGQLQPQKRLTVSIGVASYPEDADNGKDLVERADEALYTAKKSGRNQVFVVGQNDEVWWG